MLFAVHSPLPPHGLGAAPLSRNVHERRPGLRDADRSARLPRGRPAESDRAGPERGCEAIQIFNQSPRMWRPTAYTEEDFAAFRDAMRDSPIEAVLIHAVYLLNCASEDPDIRAKSLASLTHSLAGGPSDRSLRGGAASRLGQDRDVGEAIARAGETIAQALAESEGCELHLENTAGAGGTLGRSFRSWPSSWTQPAAASASGCAWTPAICSPPAMTSVRSTAWARSCASAGASSVAVASARFT